MKCLAVPVLAFALLASPTMAFTDSAMGEGVTALCEIHDSPCPEEDIVKTIHLVNKGSILLLGPVINVLCLDALVTAEALEPAEPQALHATELELKNCGLSGEHKGCEFKIEELPTFQVLQTPLDLGSMVAENGKLHFECWKGISEFCTLELTGLEFFLEGAKEAGHGMATANKSYIEPTSGFCSEKGLDALLEPLEDIHIVSQTEGAGTALCKVHSGLSCSEGDLIESLHVTTIEPTVFLSTVANVECESSLSTMSASGLAAYPDPQKISLLSLTWKGCHTQGAADNCTVTAESLPLLDLTKTSLNLGTATILDLELGVNCSILGLFEMNCVFGGTVDLPVEGAGHQAGVKNGLLKATKAELDLLEGDEHCSEAIDWDTSYEPSQEIFIVG